MRGGWCRLIEGIPAKINLIPFNEWPGAPYERSDWDRIEAFADIVYKAGYASPIRTPRGEDIMAACGQLKSATERARKSRAEIEARDAGDLGAPARIISRHLHFCWPGAVARPLPLPCDFEPLQSSVASAIVVLVVVLVIVDRRQRRKSRRQLAPFETLLLPLDPLPLLDVGAVVLEVAPDVPDAPASADKVPVTRRGRSGRCRTAALRAGIARGVRSAASGVAILGCGFAFRLATSRRHHGRFRRRRC